MSASSVADRADHPSAAPVNARLRIPVLLGSVRRGRKSLRVARFACDRLQRAGADAPLLDLADFDLPIMEERAAPARRPAAGTGPLLQRH